jgi:hypothetical protein
LKDGLAVFGSRSILAKVTLVADQSANSVHCCRRAAAIGWVAWLIAVRLPLQLSVQDIEGSAMRAATLYAALAALAMSLSPSIAQDAQALPPPKAAAKPAAAKPAAVKAGAKITPKTDGAVCDHLTYLVNDYGKDGPAKDANAGLDKTVAKFVADNKMTAYKQEKRGMSCELFLDFGFFDEYTCTASVDICPAKPAPKTTAAAKVAEPVKLVATPKPLDVKTQPKAEAAAQPKQ